MPASHCSAPPRRLRMASLATLASMLVAFTAALRAADGPRSAAPVAAKSAGDVDAAQKAAAAAADAAAFQRWKATLPRAQQAWETVLEQNLGSFYLPIYQREKVAGQVTAWDYVADVPSLPRVLLIGDSISRAYTVGVRTALAGRANVHRAPENCGPTANGLRKLEVWLGTGKWDVIYFNFGIHDRATPVADYEKRLEQIVTRLKQTGARVIWASTTPIPSDAAKKQSPESIVERNAVAARLAQKHALVVDDLFTLITPHLAATQRPNDVHFNARGYELLAAQVAATITAALPTPAAPRKS